MADPKTPFHPRTAARNLTPWWYGWNGYLVPDVYTDPVAELHAIRTAAAVIDMSPLPKYEISGPDAPAFVNQLITRDASQLPVGNLLYTPLCNHEGYLVSDGVIIRTEATVYRLSLDNLFEWLSENASGYEVKIQDLTDKYGLLALQGPRARDILAAANSPGAAALAFSRFLATTIGEVPVDLARTGFSGELGYEFWVQPEGGPALWDVLFEAGEPFGLIPAGEYAIDMARIEAGLVVITADYTGSGPDARCADVPVEQKIPATPFDLGLAHFIDFNKPDFIGKAALEALQENGPWNILTGLVVDWQAVAALYKERGLPPEVSPRVRWDALAVHSGGEPAGWATSLTWSPTVGKLIGFVRLAADLAKPGTQVQVMWPFGGETGLVSATCVALPFLPHKRV